MQGNEDVINLDRPSRARGCHLGVSNISNLGTFGQRKEILLARISSTGVVRGGKFAIVRVLSASPFAELLSNIFRKRSRFIDFSFALANSRRCAYIRVGNERGVYPRIYLDTYAKSLLSTKSIGSTVSIKFGDEQLPFVAKFRSRISEKISYRLESYYVYLFSIEHLLFHFYYI